MARTVRPKCSKTTRKYFGGGVCRSTARLDGKTVVITGGYAGIGKETARDIAKRGRKTDISDYPYPEEEGGLPPEMYTAALLEDPMSWPHDQENMAEGGSDEDEDDVDKTASTLEVIHFGLV
uniref:Uncharacterized protein n=1 Tax=Branchiostoma floridae TaxID=7739 RepID=C3XQY3_BRAFL|eukprot:XP_002613569.1 hypothetical protein BRAFLDRAFT_71791 [Branchiostoma floridae]